MIRPINTYNPTFKAARANILATADNHGNLKSLPRVLKTVENNANAIFKDADKPSTQNFFAIVGDWFINPGKKGFLTRPELSNGDLQKMALIETIDLVRRQVADKANGNKYHFHSLYTMGNHCLDSGTDFMVDVMKTTPMSTLVTNVNLDKSEKIKQTMSETPRVVKSKVYEIPDDKKSSLKHKIMFLGVTIPSMDFYNPGLCDGLEFYDNSNKKDANLKEEDIQGTIEAVREEVDRFKKENPKGVVILLSHMGSRLSEIIQKNVPQINHILNGHDHENTQTNVGKTSVNSLGKDNEIIKSLSIEFDDKGNFVRSTMTPYFPETTLADGLEEHEMQKFLNENFERDEEPLVTIAEYRSEQAIEEENKRKSYFIDNVLMKMGLAPVGGDPNKIENQYLREIVETEAQKDMDETFGVKKGITKLTYGNEIRLQNSYLMNYLTSAIKRAIRDNIDENIISVGIPSSMVRGGLENGSDNLKVMKIFDSVSEELSELKIANLKGSEIVDLINENVTENIKAPTRSTLIHWSDFEVNKSLIDKINKGESNALPEYAIRVRNQSTKSYEPIDVNREYRVVLPQKYLVKTDIQSPNKIREKFTSLNTTYDKVFRNYLRSIDYKIQITPKVKEQRIK